MVEVQDASTLTDVCTSDQLPEIELISILSESLPRYKLRAESITDFSSYHTQEWGVREPPLIQAQDLQLSNEQIAEVFKYFLICGERVSQMTKVYDDIEAVTHLLEEKEKDLELAARIGQTLLEKNKHLASKCEELKLELVNYQEQTSQLKHDLTQKDQLLQLLSTEEQTDSRQTSPSRETSSSKYVDLVHKKLSALEEENALLKTEVTNLSEQTEQIEQHEQRLTSDCIQQLSKCVSPLDAGGGNGNSPPVHHLSNTDDAQKRLRELQAEVDQKGVDLIKCQEECSSVIQQLVSGQQKMKELTIENLDMKETIKTSNEIQQELTSELFELREKYKECKDLLDCTKHEVTQLKAKSSPRVPTHRYYTGPCYIPPEGSFAAELESLNSEDKDINRKTNSKVLETAHYVRKLSSKPPSLTSSMTCSSSKARKPTGKNLLNSLPIPGSPITRASSNQMSSSLTQSDSLNKSFTRSNPGPSSQFFDEIERHRQNLGRPGIPGSKDLDAALKRLTLRRQNEESEKEYRERERHNSDMSQPSTISVDSSQQQNMEWSGTSTPTVRSPSPESELSGYGSASSFGYRMPEKLQIVKPMEGSATLHHWQRLATPHLAGLFEQRDGVQIKHGQPLNDLDSDTYSLLDVEEEVVPIKPSGRSMMTNTVTDARVMHPSTSHFPYQSPATVSSMTSGVTVMASSGGTRYGSGIISRFGVAHSGTGLSNLFDDLPSTPAKSSPVFHASVNPQPSSQISSSVVSSSSLTVGVVTSQSVVSKPRMSSSALSTNIRQTVSTTHTSSQRSQATPSISRPLSSFTDFSSLTFTTPTRTGSAMTSHSTDTNVSPGSDTPTKPKQSFGLLSNLYQFMRPNPATMTTQSGLSSIVSDTVIGDSRTSGGAYSRSWQRPWL